MKKASVPNVIDTEIHYFTTGDGCRIAYRIDGLAGKPVLVLSNSIATNLHMWDEQIPVLTKHFQILRFDTRGNGLSAAPEGDYSIDRMGLDLLELLDSLQIDRIHFCGLSLGGLIGQWLGIHASQRIDKLILANTSSYLGPHNRWNDLIKTLQTGGSMESFADMFINNWFPKDYDQQYPDVVAKFRSMVLTTTPRGLAGSFAAVRDADMRKTISLIPHKTLIIGGMYDSVTLPGHSEAIAETVPHAKLVLLPVVHLSNVESGEVFQKTILNFLLFP
jgi:3-oxoadipate enol-lactonase